MLTLWWTKVSQIFNFINLLPSFNRRRYFIPRLTGTFPSSTFFFVHRRDKIISNWIETIVHRWWMQITSCTWLFHFFFLPPCWPEREKVKQSNYHLRVVSSFNQQTKQMIIQRSPSSSTKWERGQMNWKSEEKTLNKYRVQKKKEEGASAAANANSTTGARLSADDD